MVVLGCRGRQAAVLCGKKLSQFSARVSQLPVLHIRFTHVLLSFSLPGALRILQLRTRDTWLSPPFLGLVPFRTFVCPGCLVHGLCDGIVGCRGRRAESEPWHRTGRGFPVPARCVGWTSGEEIRAVRAQSCRPSGGGRAQQVVLWGCRKEAPKRGGGGCCVLEERLGGGIVGGISPRVEDGGTLGMRAGRCTVGGWG